MAHKDKSTIKPLEPAAATLFRKTAYVDVMKDFEIKASPYYPGGPEVPLQGTL